MYAAPQDGASAGEPTPPPPAPARRRWQSGIGGTVVVLCAGVALGVAAAFVGFNRSHLLHRDFEAGALVVAEEGHHPTPAHLGSGPLKGLTELGVQMVFHTYDAYNDGSSQLWLFDAATGATSLVSGGWETRYGVTDPMNPMFWPGSTDASRWITFMAVADGEWNIFMADVDHPRVAPVNLTTAGASTGSGRHEDPKFSADGERLYLKRDGDIVVADLRWEDGLPALGEVRALTDTPMESPEDDEYVGDEERAHADTTGEESMPYPDATGRTVFFTRGAHAQADLWALDATTGAERRVLGGGDVSEYYPIVSSDGTLFFARWTSADDAHDTIWMQAPGEPEPHLLLARTGADVADPAPVTGPDLLVFSMTDGDDTPFRLYVLDVHSGEDARIPLDGVPGNMLGASLRLPAGGDR